MGPIQACASTKPQKWPAQARDILRFVLWKTAVILGRPGDLLVRKSVCGECPCLISQIMNEKVDDVVIMCSAG